MGIVLADPNAYDPNNPEDARWAMGSGGNASGSGYGGAILCENGSSPTFRNCIIEKSTVVGAAGGDGLSGYTVAGDTHGYWGGLGGNADGSAFGGAVACLTGSKPHFINCTISDCAARGSIGGHGGNGSERLDGGGDESWGGDGGYAIGDGHGGAVYCENGSDAVFEGCVFANNVATTGLRGLGGVRGGGSELPDPYPHPAFNGVNGGVVTRGTVVGGAVYQVNASPKFVDCRFVSNSAYASFTSLAYVGLYEDEESVVHVYTRGGAIAAGLGTTVSLQGCQFQKNLSGAVHVEGNSIVDVNDCSFGQNQAMGLPEEAIYTGLDYAIINNQVVYSDPNTLQLVYEGGGLYVGPNCPAVSLYGSDFHSNSAVGSGGAVRLFSDANFVNCSFAGNKAGENGGALEVYYPSGALDHLYKLNVSMTNCTFGSNDATEGYFGCGGGVHMEGFNATLTDCYFLNNRAKSGGGLFATSGTLKLSGGSISGNASTGRSGANTNPELVSAATAVGYTSATYGVAMDIVYLPRGGFLREDPGNGVDVGGGLVVAAADATIENCTFTHNSAGGIKGAGGAISFYGGYVEHKVKNCLFADNSAFQEGGAIYCSLYATPQITNSTFADNKAERLGGAIYCDWASDVTVSDSIFKGNNRHAVAEQDFGKSVVKHSLFHANPDGDYGLYDFATGKTTTSAGADLHATNTVGDPLFVSGPLGEFYLSQTKAGQAQTSPAVDAGSASATEATLAGRTTRTDGVGDTGVVDLGYHAGDHTGMPKYTLTAQVVGGHGTISPTSGSYYAGTPVAIKAVPQPGWRIAQWSGTSDDASRKIDNVVLIGPDRNVTVQFEQPRTIVVGSTGDYTTIQHAIDAAADGDVIEIQPGLYQPVAVTEYPWGYIRIHNKSITLTGTNPDDPAVVASTMLRRYRFEISQTGPETIIDGLSIGDVNWIGATGYDGDRISGGPHDGEQGSSMWGGAMTIQYASPTIRNCRFVDCSVTGGNGGNGSNGNDAHPIGFDGGWSGFAYGGAVYIGFLSSPTFENCLFENCRAYGGNGGNGGTGQDASQGGRGGNWMLSEAIEQTIRLWWDGWEWGPFDRDGNLRSSYFTGISTSGQDIRGYYDDYWRYSGYGGAVYIEYYSSPRFIDCNFTNNGTFGGLSGIGAADPLPDNNYNIENFGGAVYIGNASDPEFIGCIFQENSADMNTVATPDDVYVSFGGSIAFENDCTPSFVRCTVEDSNACVGGAIWGSDSRANIVDCNIAGNTAYQGGGVYLVDSTGTVSSTLFTRNRAFQGVLDPNFLGDPNSPLGGTSASGGGFCGINSPVEIRDSEFTGNRALSSGGGVYLNGSDQDVNVAPLLHNCLIWGNAAGRDGGGVAVSWYSEPIISNCSIVDNVVSGAFSEALGGGLSVVYDANAVVINSIIWGNTSSDDGSQVAVGSSYAQRPSALQISHSDVQPSLDPAALGGALDLVLLFDSSATMYDEMVAIKTMANDIVEQIAAAAPDARIAVTDFKDFNNVGGSPATDVPYRVVTPFTEDTSRVVNAINSIQTPAGSGGDVPDSIYYALIRAIDGNDLGGWRTGRVNRVILLIGDAPPRDPETQFGYTMSDVAEAATRMPGKRIFTVQLGINPTTTLYFRSIAGGAAGGMTQVADANDAGLAVIEGISEITQIAPSIRVSTGSMLPGWHAEEGVWDAGTGNIGEDPQFIAGYYLSQTAAGQSRQSPAVDAGGSAAGAVAGMSTRTTRADGIGDADNVDMGYHYAQGVTLYTLNSQVLPDPTDGLVHGTVTPAFTVVYEGSADNVIRLEVKPEDGWKVNKWSGTDNDAEAGLINYVTLTGDRRVTVTLQKRTARVVTIPGDFSTIQGAVTAAEDGDTIMVDPGTYYSGYETVGLIIDKAVTITSRNPDDPCTVAATVIRGPGAVNGNQWSRLGVVFTAAATRKTVFNGFTLENFGGTAVNGNDGDRAAGHPSGGDGAPMHGAAMILMPGASPTIKNCVIRNNSIVAGNGGNGVAATATQNAGRGGWGGWARGGAIYCASDTSPVFVNCIIENNFAQGGTGGNGGGGADGGGLANFGGNYTPPVRVNIDADRLGAEAANDDLWKLWQWDYAMLTQVAFESPGGSVDTTNVPLGGGPYAGDYRWYSAYGGGVFIDARSKAEFIECTISGNRTIGGLTGQGGAQPPANRLTEPLIPFEVPSYGGGVYCAADTTVTFRACNFENNTASEPNATTAIRSAWIRTSAIGGGIAAEGTASVLFVDCNFVDNRADTGGGLYMADSKATVIDTRIATNTAIRGAGLAGVGGDISIAGCEVRNNTATVDAGDTADPNGGVMAMGAGLLFSSATAQVQDCNIAGNSSQGSGGGIYLRGENNSSIVNCLIRSNLAIRDGGGISTNWYATPTIRNCTFFGNSSPGDPNADEPSGFGGGLFCGYFSDAKVIDSILWQNGARQGNRAGRRDRVRARSPVRQAQRVVQQHHGRSERCVRRYRLHAGLRRRHPPQEPAVRRWSARQVLPEQQCGPGIHEPVHQCGQRHGRCARHVAVHDPDGQLAGRR